MSSAEQCILPISEISSYVQRWRIRARVTSKSALRTFSKGATTGKVFSVHLLDAEGGEIRASFFNEAADRHFDTLEQGKCYTLARGAVRIANQQFNPCKHRYELVFDRAADVEEAADDERIEAVKLSLSSLRSVQSQTLPCTVDLCGIITAVGPKLSFTSRDGRCLVKRELTVADDTATSMVVTIWGDRAKQEDRAFEGNPVICLRGVLVKEWSGGRSGSLTEGGALIIAPKGPEAERVQRWWSEDGKSQSLVALSRDSGGGAGARAAKATDLAGLRLVAGQALQQPETYDVVCRLGLVQLQKRGEKQLLFYSACQEQKEGKSLPCNRRVDSSGFCAACNRAGKAAPRFNVRCRFMDCGDSAWLTTFHEAATEVLGITGERAAELERGEGGREALEAAVLGRYFSQPLHLTVRAKLDGFNGEMRTNVTCVDARPVGHGVHGRLMLESIRGMLAEDTKKSKDAQNGGA